VNTPLHRGSRVAYETMAALSNSYFGKNGLAKAGDAKFGSCDVTVGVFGVP
jgi:hypothetical protein